MSLITRDEILNLIRCRRTVFFLLTIILLTLAMDYGMNRILARQYRLDQEMFVTLELAAFRARLEERINTNLYLVHGMAANISIHPDMSTREFDDLARVLLGKSNNALRNIGAAPDFVIRFMYPLSGNEKALGLDYRKTPEQWAQALAAREKRTMAVAGPLNLVQGGVGLIARVPVFLAESGDFWGLVSSVLDLEALMDQAGVDAMRQRVDMAVRGRDGKGGAGEVFWGDSGLFEAEADAVTMSVSLPSGSWLVSGVPAGGWTPDSPYAWAVHAGFAFLAVFGCFTRIQTSLDRLSLKESENRLRAMSQASHDALVMIDSHDRVTFWNPAAESMFGYSEAEMLGRPMHEFITQPEDASVAKKGMGTFASSGTGAVLGCVMEMEGVRRSGEVFPVERSVASFQLGGKWYAVGSMRDISQRKLAELRLNELATMDELTGLFNRRYFMEQAEAQLRQATRYRKDFCFMMFDLDHFKKINDTHGHDVGDEVLRRVGQTLRQVMRGTDVFGRVGGEEFAVAMPETNLEDARNVAERLREKFAQVRVQTWSEPVHFTVSIGISHLSSPETLLSQLIKRADEALYRAKDDGRNRVAVDEGGVVAPPA